jgi:hypothetical protein
MLHDVIGRFGSEYVRQMQAYNAFSLLERQGANAINTKSLRFCLIFWDSR